MRSRVLGIDKKMGFFEAGLANCQVLLVIM